MVHAAGETVGFIGHTSLFSLYALAYACLMLMKFLTIAGKKLINYAKYS